MTLSRATSVLTGFFSLPEKSSWLTVREIVLTTVIASAVTATEIYFSKQIGLLAYPLNYESVGYMLPAKSLFYEMSEWWIHRPSLRHIGYALFVGMIPPATLWQKLMMLSFLLLGEGEWQAYTARFWPTLLLLLLVLWVMRHRSGSRVAWVAVLFTALLPTISCTLRWSLITYLSGTVVIFDNMRLADLLPDLLSTALLLWTIVPLIERVHNLDRSTWLISGAAAGLSILAKSSMLPELLFAWGLTVVYVSLVNRSRLQQTVFTGFWCLPPLAILTTPWGLAGGARYTLGYIYVNSLTANRVLWLATYGFPFFQLASWTWYWGYFPVHMGPLEGWTMLGIGLALSVASVLRKPSQKDNRIIAYLGISAALYILATATPNKNFIIGLPFYLLLWIFSWRVLIPLLTKWVTRRRIAAWLLISVLLVYTTLIVGGGLYVLQAWTDEGRQTWADNTQVIKQIAADMRAILKNSDTFMWAPLYGFPATLQYYMIDQQGNYPQTVWIDLREPPDQFVRQHVNACKAVLVYQEDIAYVAQFAYVHPAQVAYWHAIAKFVRESDSSYSRVMTYHFSVTPVAYYEYGSKDRFALSLDLYVKQPAPKLASEEQRPDKYMRVPLRDTVSMEEDFPPSLANRYSPFGQYLGKTSGYTDVPDSFGMPGRS